MFVSSPETRDRYERMLPFQVFSAWNGIAAISPKPFLPPHNIRFRRARRRTDEEFECQVGVSSFLPYAPTYPADGRPPNARSSLGTCGKLDSTDTK